MDGKFLSTYFLFAGTHKAVLTIFVPHVLERWRTRIASQRKCFSSETSAKECLAEIKNILSDKRLSDIYVRAKNQNVVLYVEERNLYLVMSLGKFRQDEIKVSTVISANKNNIDNRCLVNNDDLCYVLPIEGKMRFGKEKKFFKWKKV